MRVLCVIFGVLCGLSLTTCQFTYIFEVQDENRGPKSELFGDLSQFKFVPPSQLPKNDAIRPPALAPQPSFSRREDPIEEEPVRRRPQRLSGAAQNPRQFVVRAPQQDSRQALLREQLNQAQPQPQPAPQPIQYQAQPQTALSVAQPPPQSFPQLAPHQTAHLNPVLRTIVPRNQVAPAPAPAQDPNFELLQSFVRAQSQPSDRRPTALQTLGQTPRYSPQPQPAPQPQPQFQPQPQRQPQYNQPSGVVLGQTQTGLPTLQISNGNALTDADLQAIEEHNRRVQAFLRQRQQDLQNRPQSQPQLQPPVRSQPLRNQPTAQNQNELNERLASQRAQLQRQNAEQERALREREYQERVERERMLQRQIEQMLRPETRAQVAPVLQNLPYIRSQPQMEAGVEYVQVQPQPQPQRRPETQPQRRPEPRPQIQPQPQEQPEVRPLPVSYNNVRVPDSVRRRPAPAPTTPAPRNYAIPRTTSAPQQSNQNSKPATLGLAALPSDTGKSFSF